MTQRVPRVTVPWRTVSVGECGKSLSDDDAAITVDYLTQRIADHGKPGPGSRCVRNAGVVLGRQFVGNQMPWGLGAGDAIRQ